MTPNDHSPRLRLLHGCVFAAHALVLSAMPGPVLAEDAARAFTGPYAGGQMSYLWLDRGVAAGPNRIGAGGIHAGITTPLAGSLLGAEIELDTQHRLFSDRSEAVHGLARLKLRAGGQARGVHAYGTLGLSHADTTAGAGTGFTLGIGAETAIGGNWRLGAELLHDRIEDIGTPGQDFGLTSLSFRASFGF